LSGLALRQRSHRLREGGWLLYDGAREGAGDREERQLNQLIILLWATTVLPFATLPWVTIARAQPQPWYSSHALFHVVYLPIIAVAIWAAWRIAVTAPQRVMRVLAWLIVAAQTAGFIGHAGELISVTRNGGWDAGEEIFDEAVHALSANLTVPALLIGIVLVVVLTIVFAASSRRAAAAGAVGRTSNHI
jgi:hypothetical protein